MNFARTYKHAAVGLGLAAAAILAAPSAWPDPNQAGPPPRMLFTRWMVGTILKTPDDERLVNFSHGDYVAPRLVPGEDAFLLNSKRGGRMGIWLFDFNGQGRRICDGDQVSISADGKRIVFRRRGAIYLRDLHTGAELRVSPQGWNNCTFPSFVPDGRVLFVAAAAKTSRLYLIGPQGREKPRLLAEGNIPSAPRCSPDGKLVAFQNGPHIYLVHVDGTGLRRLTWAPGVQSWPVWSADGKRLAYLQSPTTVDGPHHVYIVSVDNPTRAILAARNVMPGPDWNGRGFQDGYQVQLPHARPAAWVLEGDGGEEALKSIGKEPWRALSMPAKGLTGLVAITSASLALAVDCARAHLVLLQRRKEELSPIITVRLTDPNAAAATCFTDLCLDASSPDAVQLSLVAQCQRKKRLFNLALNHAHPLLAISGQGLALVQFPFAAAVLPDRLAADLVITPAASGPAELPVPQCPMLLCLSGSGDALYTIITPEQQQSIALEHNSDKFTGMRVDVGGGTIWLSFLSGERLWRQAQLRRADSQWQIRWTNPFAGLWRTAVPARPDAVAFMVAEDSPRRSKWRSFAELSALSDKPDRALIYLYGRTANTPPALLTPSDALYEALGLAADEVIDIEGIRAYRHAPEPVPYKHPKVCLRLIEWMQHMDRPGGEKKARDVCRDIKLTFRGLDARLAEYQHFITSLAAIKGQAESERQFLSDLAAQAAKATGPGRRKMTPYEEIKQAADQDMRADKARKRLRQTVERALEERLAALRAYRAFARRVRLAAGKALLAGRISPSLCHKLRAMAWNVLRHRYYLEDDWLGEQPIGGPEVPHEKVLSL